MPEIAGPYATLAAAKEAGAVTVNVGVFINTIISFCIIAFSVFLIIKQMNTLKRNGGTDRACDKRMPLLFIDHSDKSLSLPSLHLRAEGVKHLPHE